MELLKRKIDKYLLDWKNNPQRKPLIVKGARQIGKTESIRAYGKANYDSVIEINFVLQKKFRTIFDNGYEVDTIIKNISLLEPSWEFIPHKTLIFFDELQKPSNNSHSSLHTPPSSRELHTPPSSRELHTPPSTTVLIGPEGDFSIDEVRQAIDAGYISVHLGKSRLRTETAGLSAVMMMQLAKS